MEGGGRWGERCDGCEAGWVVTCLGPEATSGPGRGGHLGEKRVAPKGTGFPVGGQGPPSLGGWPWVSELNLPKPGSFTHSRDPEGQW